LTDQQEPPDISNPFDRYSDLADLAADTSLPALEDPSTPSAQPPRSPLLTGLIVALLLVVISISVFQLLRDDETPGTTAEPTDASTTSVPDQASSTTDIPATSSPDPTATTDGTGSTPATTVPVEVPGSFEPYSAVGDVIPFDDLRMVADGLGPVKFGTPAAEAIGRLITSLGDPDDDSGPVLSTGTYGVCAGGLERIVRWGPLVAVVVVDSDGTETFGGYRLDFAYAVDGLGSPATELETLSGLKAGQSVVALKDIYSNFQVTFEATDDITTFQLRSAKSGNLLLWGPVTSEDTKGIVLGIYALDACGRF
jgi:hypothetical protein